MEKLIGVVGPCAAGKTTLVANLRRLGYRAKHIAQEHSYVPYMWQKITQPDILIFLEVSYENTLLRRKLSWSRDEYNEQLFRLVHARQHADLVIETDALTPEAVLHQAIDFIRRD